MQTPDNHILAIAHTVRAWCEKHVKRKPKHDFHKDPSLGCMCGYASTVLLACLQHFGVQGATLHTGVRHAFLRVNRRILDITATQFKTRQYAQSQPVEYTTVQSLNRRYADPTSWVAFKDPAASVEQAFELLNPKTQGGFPPSQFWLRRCDMHRTIKAAIRYCEENGLTPVSAEQPL